MKKPTTILLIEDEAIIALAMKTELEQHIPQARVVLATSVAGAWDSFTAQSGAVDLVLMDACLGSKSPNTLALTHAIRAAADLLSPDPRAKSEAVPPSRPRTMFDVQMETLRDDPHAFDDRVGDVSYRTARWHHKPKADPAP